MDNKIITQIMAHAEREFPREACGLLINVGGSVEVFECLNTHPEPEQSFLIDPITYAARARHVLAVYHTHPNKPATPSMADKASAERANVPFLIVSYPSGEIDTYTPTGALPAPLEGRPFVYGVLDCVSLVIDYYKHELNISLDDTERKCWEWWTQPENANAFVNGFKQRGFVEVADLQKNDVIIMAIGSEYPNHAAVYLGDSVMLHHPSEGRFSTASMYGHFWRDRTTCFLRLVV